MARWWATALLGGVDLRLQHADIRHVPVLLGVVQAVAHHELVRHDEASQVGGDGLGPAGGLIQQGHDGDGGSALGHKILLQKGQGIAGIQNILHDDEVPAGNILLEVVGDLHPAGGGGGVFVRADGNELHIAFQLAGPNQVRHEHKGPLQHTEEQGLFALEAVIQFLAHLSDAGLQFFFRHQDLQDILLHLTSHDDSPLSF